MSKMSSNEMQTPSGSVDNNAGGSNNGTGISSKGSGSGNNNNGNDSGSGNSNRTNNNNRRVDSRRNFFSENERT